METVTALLSDTHALTYLLNSDLTLQIHFPTTNKNQGLTLKYIVPN